MAEMGILHTPQPEAYGGGGAKMKKNSIRKRSSIWEIFEASSFKEVLENFNCVTEKKAGFLDLSENLLKTTEVSEAIFFVHFIIHWQLQTFSPYKL